MTSYSAFAAFTYVCRICRRGIEPEKHLDGSETITMVATAAGDLADVGAHVECWERRGERCPDCNVEPGQPHVNGCDVARCTECGWQRIAHDGHYDGWDQIWTGEWPGLAEVREHGLDDLNDLYARAATGLMVWSRERQRWEPRTPAAEITRVPVPCFICWLLDQVAEDEHRIRAALPGVVWAGHTPSESSPRTWRATHLLKQCELARKFIECHAGEHSPTVAHADECRVCLDACYPECGPIFARPPCQSLRIFGDLHYGDRAGYREEWRP